MQVTATLSEGLKREFRVVVPLTELSERSDARLFELKDKVQINGFRPGKVPMNHLKKLYGKSVVGEVVEAIVGEVNEKILSENGFKTATQPNVRLPEEEEAANAILDGKSDLDYVVSFEILPAITLGDFTSIAITRPVVEISDKDVNETLEGMAKANVPFEEKKGKAAKDDRLTISFVGTIDGEAFEGGAGDDVPLVLGSGQFIPGFEDQLTGAKAGDEVEVKVAFPADYGAAHLAGKDAVFATKVTKVEKPGKVAIDDEFAKTIGFDDLEKLKEAIKERIANEFSGMSRQIAKRALLDALDSQHSFDLPQTLVEQEFDNVWRQVTADLENRQATFETEGTTEDAARADYQKIAERRVRLGLVLAEVGDVNKIQITDEEVTRALVEEARKYPGQEQQVWDFYRKNAQALASLRAPIFEEKVVDHIFSLAKVTDETVSRDELMSKVNAEEKAA